MISLQQAKKLLLNDSNLTCVLVNDTQTLTASERGIKPVLQWLAQIPSPLAGAFVADKVVGKAAALLFVHGGIKALYTQTISQPALDVLEQHNIPIQYDTLVLRIKNRVGDGLCPMESRVWEIDDPLAAYEALKNYRPF